MGEEKEVGEERAEVGRFGGKVKSRRSKLEALGASLGDKTERGEVFEGRMRKRRNAATKEKIGFSGGKVFALELDLILVDGRKNEIRDLCCFAFAPSPLLVQRARKPFVSLGNRRVV